MFPTSPSWIHYNHPNRMGGPWQDDHSLEKMAKNRQQTIR